MPEPDRAESRDAEAGAGTAGVSRRTVLAAGALGLAGVAGAQWLWSAANGACARR